MRTSALPLRAVHPSPKSRTQFSEGGWGLIDERTQEVVGKALAIVRAVWLLQSRRGIHQSTYAAANDQINSNTELQKLNTCWEKPK